jgi:hypothetical protein
MLKLIFFLLTIHSLIALAEPSQQEPIIEYLHIHKNMELYRFELQNLEDHPYSNDTNQANIIISKQNGVHIQTIPVAIRFPQPSFDFIDLNDDGYVDSLLTTSDAGGGSNSFQDVFLYVPKLKKFVVSKSLSAKGNVSKHTKRGCAKITYERNPSGYTQDEWCFNLKTGRWKMIKSARYEVTGE